MFGSCFRALAVILFQIVFKLLFFFFEGGGGGGGGTGVVILLCNRRYRVLIISSLAETLMSFVDCFPFL